jgi:hypothetical protein
MIVWVAESEVEAVLARGRGPGLPVGAVCPGCEGALGGWGSYSRRVRRRGVVVWLRVRRAICFSCGVTHALLPSFVHGRRLDLADVVFLALVAGAAGRGHRRVGAAAGVPADTARGWLRRARRDSGLLRAYFGRLAGELGAAGARPPPRASELAALIGAIADAHRAAGTRFGAAAAGTLSAFSVAACGGGLLANTSPLFPGRGTAARVGPVTEQDP